MRQKFTRTYHGGPQETITPSRAKHGLKQSDKLKHGSVLTIVENGQVLLGKRFRRAMKTSEIQDLSPQPSVSASATPQQLPGRGDVPAKIEPPTRKNQEYRAASPSFRDTTTPKRPEERIPGRDRGSH